MPTEKQLQASRANGALSRGPVTERGKRNSSRNSTRHGLLARATVLEGESGERFRALVQAFMDEYQPGSPTEVHLVHTLASVQWRQIRIWAAQKVALDQEIARQDPSVGPVPLRAAYAIGAKTASCPNHLLLRYENSLDRQFSRALTHLLAFQSRARVLEGASGPHGVDKQTQAQIEPGNQLEQKENTGGLSGSFLGYP